MIKTKKPDCKNFAAVAAKFLAALLLLAVTAPSAPQSDTQVRRYLLSVGANNGGRDKVVLRYAVSDAKAFANVLMDMGGVEKENALLLSDPTKRQLLASIDNLNKLIAGGDGAKDVRKEVFVYYSGHADEEGLKLAGETLGWSDFRNAVTGINADVRVAVLDACGSGAITRTKGGVARPAFLSDASMNMKGYAFLTSSNENEASQESDRIKGSYFTHALLSGMRGAADMTGNGKVTINEAYQYAFNETLQSTQNTRAGTQHPSRDMNLAGTGDIVMTDLRQTSATLSLDADIEGRFFIRDENGNLFAELRKIRGRPIELGIPPGKYTVQMEAPSRLWSAGDVLVSSGAKTTLTMSDMRPMGARRRTVSRGDNGELAVSEVADSLAEVELADNEYLCGDDDLPNDVAEACFESDEYLSGGAAASVGSAAAGDTTSAQTAAGENIAASSDTLTGVSAACAAPYRYNITAIAKNDVPESGMQISFANFARAPYCGMQIGFVNVLDHDSKAVQIGLANVANGAVGDAQLGIVNTAGDVGLFQYGVVNVARDVYALQLGTVNVARNVEYVQYGAVNVAQNVWLPIGVVNIARYSELPPIGLINIVGNGIMDVTYYTDVSGDAGFILRTGMPWYYSLVEFGVPFSDDVVMNGEKPDYSWGWGIGTRFGMNGKFTVNLDLLWTHVYKADNDNTIWCGEYCADVGVFGLSEPLPDKSTNSKLHDWPFNNLYKLRLGVSYNSPFRRLAGTTGDIAFTGGVSMNLNPECKHTNDWQKEERSLSHYSKESKRGHRYHAWPGVYFGITVGKVRQTDRDGNIFVRGGGQ